MMQLNFLQEDLLEIMQQGKPARPVVAVQTPPAKRDKSAQASLLAELPAQVKKAASPAASKQVAQLPAASEEKSPDAFKTISEAADILGVPTYVLRFWESQFSQIHPTKSRGGRRYYRPQDMDVLTTIKNLLYKEGYTIKGARKAFAQMKQDVALAEQPVAVQVRAEQKPLITPKQKSQLSSIRSELLGLREQLSPYL